MLISQGDHKLKRSNHFANRYSCSEKKGGEAAALWLRLLRQPACISGSRNHRSQYCKNSAVRRDRWSGCAPIKC